MTTNEQIMIDGVDVLYICKYGQTGLPICVDLEHRYCKLKSTNSKKCNLRPVVEYSDYEKLYKQLQRMTAKYEELRNTSNKYYVQVLDERDKLREDVAKFNETLELIAICGTKPLKEENSRYKQALDEIEKMIESIITDCDPITPNYRLNQINDRAYDILDIIHKAKGEE